MTYGRAVVYFGIVYPVNYGMSSSIADGASEGAEVRAYVPVEYIYIFLLT